MTPEQEVDKLRAAIKRAGFEVCQTSGDWTIHDISEYGKREEEETLDVINENIDLQIRLNKAIEALKGILPNHRKQSLLAGFGVAETFLLSEQLP